MDGEIDPASLQELLESDEPPLLLDVSPAAAYEAGHVPGSEHVPLAELPAEIDRIADADRVVTVCPHGLASVKAARIVSAYEDFDGTVESLAGGVEAWDGPIERGANTEDAPDAPF